MYKVFVDRVLEQIKPLTKKINKWTGENGVFDKII